MRLTLESKQLSPIFMHELLESSMQWNTLNKLLAISPQWRKLWGCGGESTQT